MGDVNIQSYAKDILGYELSQYQVDYIKAWLSDGTIIVQTRPFGRRAAYLIASAIRKDLSSAQQKE